MSDRPVIVPAPNGRMGKSFSTYLVAQLFHAGKDLEWRSKTIKTQHDKQNGADVFFQTEFLWEYENDELAFLRSVLSLFPILYVTLQSDETCVLYFSLQIPGV